LEFRDISRVSEAITAKGMKTDPYCQRRNCSQLNKLFQRCIDCIDIARRSSARGRQTTLRLQKQVFIHTRLSRAYLALARLSCTTIPGDDSCRQQIRVLKTAMETVTVHDSDRYPMAPTQLAMSRDV